MYHFLLGGHDLEMIEIRRILEVNNIAFTDNNLAWGAALDDYKAILTQHPDKHYVGVELAIKDASVIPKNYIEIDHHNDKTYLPASIEQIAELLNISLSRYQQLIAANDRGYIPAMKEMGASDEVIQQIRQLDRKAQGVTEEMEQLALESLSNARLEKDVVVIKTPLDKFSPIVDRVETKKLLIYNSKTLNYYGNGVKQLTIIFNNLIKKKKAYHGGGDKGFFGTVVGAFSETELNNLIQEILKNVTENNS